MEGSLPSNVPDRYRGSFDLRSFPAGGGKELVYSLITQTAHLLPSDAIRLLLACRNFATLEQHAVQLQSEFKIGPEKGEPLRRQLADLVQRGLLVSHRTLAEHCSQKRSSDEPARVACIGIPTRNRPDLLERCVRSYAKAGRETGCSRPFLVVDDSETPGMQQANQDMLAGLRRHYGVEIHYAGPAEKAAFADRLAAETGVPADLVHFALLNPEGCPLATGSSRNALLLDSAGEALLQVDDDTVCQLTAVPGAESGLVLTSRHDATEFWFYSEEEAATAGAAGLVMDFAGLHEGLLGRTVGEVAACLGVEGESNLDTANTDFVRKLAPRGGRVLATSAGVVGDSGMGASNYLLALDEPSRSRLLASESIYRFALARRQVLRGVVRTTISDTNYCMGLNLGLDNRTLLPPFFPVQRDQDGIFGACLRICAPDGYLGFFPWALWHRRPTAPAYPGGKSWTPPGNPASNDLILILIEFCRQPPDRGSIANNGRALGRTLADWGRVPLKDFAEHLRQLAWIIASRHIRVFESRLGQFAAQPEFWARDVRTCVAHLQDRLVSPDFGIPRDLSAAFGTEAALAVLQRLVRRFGDLLQCWPELWETARQSRATGLPLARAL